MSDSDVNDADSPKADADEGRLLDVVEEYVRELEAGHRPNRQEWLARHPELQPALADCLDGVNLMHEAAEAMKPANAQSPLGSGLQPGMPIGDFEIVREIGRGGMGIVYEAIQLSLGRHVALKTLPFAAGFDSRYLQRFRQEAQAAAQLHHANIVPVYAVGCERGVNFYAMQLIDGQSLDCVIRQLCRDAGMNDGDSAGSHTRISRSWTGRLSDVPETEPLSKIAPLKLSPRRDIDDTADRNDTQRVARLSADLSTEHNKQTVYRTMARLMAQAAEALEYAHQQGIIHRDIKPANLLVDMHHNLWIADFGLAHLHGEQNLTRTGDVLGTMRYASPEQVSGQRVVLDHRTDLYSLGATFYELITLRPVFAGATRHSILQQILNHDPVAPRSIDRAIPHELETILLKLLSKSPADRYRSAQEVADDLHRFLRDEPILARPPSILERMRKWGRRHPAYVVAFVLVMFATLVISGISNWLVAQANSRTQTALVAERLRAEEAERSFLQARHAVDYMIHVSENDLADHPPMQSLQKKLLETSLVYYQQFIAQHRDNPVQEAELLAVQERLKKVLDDLLVMEGAGQLVLLVEKDVQTDLQLNEAERRRFDAIAKQFAEERTQMLQSYQTLTPEQRRERFLSLARSSEDVAQSILSKKQVRRLKQISIQLHGSRAFTEPEVVEALKLTESQRHALRQVEMEMFAGPPPDQSDEKSHRESRRRMVRLAMSKSLAVLTPEQAAKWHEMVGEPFRGRLSIFLPGMLPEL